MNNADLQNELKKLKNNIDNRTPVMTISEFMSKIMHKIFSTVLTEDVLCEFIKNTYEAQILEYKEVEAGVRFSICLRYMYDHRMTFEKEINSVGTVDVFLVGFCDNTTKGYDIPVDAGEFSFKEEENKQIGLEAFEKALVAEFENNNIDPIRVLNCRYDTDIKGNCTTYEYYATMLYKI